MTARLRQQKAQIFLALLGKQYGVCPEGWREAAGAYGEEGSYRSVADIVDEDSLTKVRSFKQQLKAAAKAKIAVKPHSRRAAWRMAVKPHSRQPASFATNQSRSVGLDCCRGLCWAA